MTLGAMIVFWALGSCHSFDGDCLACLEHCKGTTCLSRGKTCVFSDFEVQGRRSVKVGRCYQLGGKTHKANARGAWITSPQGCGALRRPEATEPSVQSTEVRAVAPRGDLKVLNQFNKRMLKAIKDCKRMGNDAYRLTECWQSSFRGFFPTIGNVTFLPSPNGEDSPVIGGGSYKALFHVRVGREATTKVLKLFFRVALSRVDPPAVRQVELDAHIRFAHDGSVGEPTWRFAKVFPEDLRPLNHKVGNYPGYTEELVQGSNLKEVVLAKGRRAFVALTSLLECIKVRPVQILPSASDVLVEESGSIVIVDTGEFRSPPDPATDGNYGLKLFNRVRLLFCEVGQVKRRFQENCCDHALRQDKCFSSEIQGKWASEFWRNANWADLLLGQVQ